MLWDAGLQPFSGLVERFWQNDRDFIGPGWTAVLILRARAFKLSSMASLKGMAVYCERSAPCCFTVNISAEDWARVGPASFQKVCWVHLESEVSYLF